MSVFVVCLIAAVLGYVAAMPILGPIAMMVIARGIEGRFDEARKLGIGAAISEGVYAGIAFATSATLFQRYPAAMPISRVVTSIVLAVVGFSFVRYKPKPLGAVNERKGRSAFALGLLTSGLNPTIVISWTAAATGIGSRGFDMQSWMAVPFGLSAAAGIIGWYFTLVALMTKYHSRLPTRGLHLSIRIAGGLLLLLSGWTLLAAFR